MKRFIPFVITALGLSTIFGCGLIEPTKQEGTKLDNPEPDSFSLAGDTLPEGKKFGGTVVIWDEAPTPEGMSAIAKVSNTALSLQVETMDYMNQKVLPLAPLFQKGYDDIVAGLTEVGREEYIGALTLAATWIAGSDPAVPGGKLLEVARGLAMMGAQPLDQADIAQAQKMFGTYCEAKIWERAVHKALINEKYTRRPTPLSLCEGIYQKQLNLFQSPECAPSKEPKSYFSCLWRDGVLKTNLFARYAMMQSPAGEALASLSDAEVINYINSGVIPNDKKILSQRMISVERTNGEVVDINLATTGFPDELLVNSVTKIIGFMESEREPRVTDAQRLIRENADVRSEDEVAYIQAVNTNLRTAIGAYAKLAGYYYVNENKFNAIFKAPSAIDENDSFVTKDDLLAKAMVEFKPILEATTDRAQELENFIIPSRIAYLEGIGLQALVKFSRLSVPDDEAEKTAFCSREIERFEKIEYTISEAQGRFVRGMLRDSDFNFTCLKNHITSKGFEVLSPEEVTRAVWQMSLGVRRSEDGNYLFADVVFNNSGTEPTTACAALKDKACDESYAPMSLDQELNELTFDVDVYDLQKMLLAQSPRAELEKNSFFSELDNNAVNNGTLRFTAIVNNVEDLTSSVVGSIKILPKGSEEAAYSGSVKLREEKPAAQAATEAFSTFVLDVQSRLEKLENQ